MHIKDENLTRINSLGSQLRTLLEEGRVSEALAQARTLHGIDPDDLNVCHVVSVYLIDGGSEIGDIHAVDEGLAIIDRILTDFPRDGSAFFVQNCYNQSNGYAARYSHFRSVGKTELADAALQLQKKILQELLIRRERIPSDLLPNVLTNYANCLDHLNRTFEAIDHFLLCLAIQPDHGIAKGNCGVALARVPAWTKQHHLENYLASWDLVSVALATSEEIIAYANPSAVANLELQRDKLSNWITNRFSNGIGTIEEFRAHRGEAHSEPSAKWLTEILQDRLLLSFNQIPLLSRDEAKDDAFIDTLSYGISSDDEEESISLLYLLNTIKEEFASSRYLYYHATKYQRRLKTWNAPTSYADPEGSAEFGLIAGMLKTSFRSAVDLLDKVALFLAIYFRLGYSVKFSFNINNVWFLDRDRRKGVHPLLEPRLVDNYPLSGLRDFQRDFFLQEYPGRIKDTRNAAVHRWLTLRWLRTEGNDEDESWSLDDFASLTLFILRQAKDAALLLFATINVEEQRRKSETGERVVALPRSLFVGRPPSSRTKKRRQN